MRYWPPTGQDLCFNLLYVWQTCCTFVLFSFFTIKFICFFLPYWLWAFQPSSCFLKSEHEQFLLFVGHCRINGVSVEFLVVHPCLARVHDEMQVTFQDDVKFYTLSWHDAGQILNLSGIAMRSSSFFWSSNSRSSSFFCSSNSMNTIIMPRNQHFWEGWIGMSNQKIIITLLFQKTPSMNIL